MIRRFAPGLLAIGAALALCVACSLPLPQATSCSGDADCPRADVCALGSCVNPADQRLGAVDVEIDPSAAGLPVQSRLALNLRDNPRVDVSLASGVTWSGRVRHGDGGPGVAAQVLARPEEFIAGRALAPNAQTDDAGNFSVLLVDGERYGVTVVPGDAALPPAYDDAGFVANGDSSGRVTLDPPFVDDAAGIRVRGFVKAGEGAAEQGIPQLALHVENQAGRRVSSTARTAADGSFTVVLSGVAGTAGDPLTLTVSPTSDNPSFPSLGVPVDPDKAHEGVLDAGVVSLGVVLTPAHFVARVVDEAGHGVPGATATLQAEVGNGAFQTLVQADGAGVLDAQLPPGTYTVVVVAPETSAAGLLVQGDVDVPSTNADLELTLPARVRFAGAVLDPDGATLPGAQLTITRVVDPAGPDAPLAHTFVSFTTQSGDDGTFEVSVDPGRYRVSTRPPRGKNAPASSELVTVPDGGLQADVRLPARAVVAGTVLSSGAPVDNAYVRVFSDFLLDEQGSAILVGEAVSGSDGAFEMVVPDFVGSGVQNPTPP